MKKRVHENLPTARILTITPEKYTAVTKYKTMKELASDRGKKHDCGSCKYRLIRTKTVAGTVLINKV